MALTKKGSDWEAKNSLYVLLACVPLFNFFCFFYMSNRIKNRKWSILGWVILILNVLILTSSIITTQASNPYSIPSYYNIEDSPHIEDYLTSDQYLEYKKFDDNCISYKDSEEYKQYKKDCDAYKDREKEWKNLPENVEQLEKHYAWRDRMNSASNALMAMFFIFYFLFIVMAFNERPKYLKLLEQSENQDNIVNRLTSINKNTVNIEKQIVLNENETPLKKLDVNLANEDEFASIPGITIVDAKKAIKYREENVGFSSKDEFFGVINAKPHIIAQIEDQIIIGEIKRSESSSVGNSKRRIDL